MNRFRNRTVCLVAPLICIFIYAVSVSLPSQPAPKVASQEVHYTVGQYRLISPESQKENVSSQNSTLASSTPERATTVGTSTLGIKAEDPGDFTFFDISETDLNRSKGNLSVSFDHPALEKYASRQLRSLDSIHPTTGALPESADSASLDAIPDQSFESFYATLFPDKSKSLNTPAWASTAVQSGENPFAEAIEQRSVAASRAQSAVTQAVNPASAPTVPVRAASSSSASVTVASEAYGIGQAWSATASSTGAASSQTSTVAPGSGSGSATVSAGANADNGPTVSVPAPAIPASPGNTSTSQATISQPTIAGTNSGSFLLVGDIKRSGSAEIVPAIHYQGGRFEVPFLGQVQLKVAVIADPLNSFRSLAVEDINNDSLADVVWFSESDPFVLVWLGTASGDFTYAGASAVIGRGKSAALFDVDGDRIKDLALIESTDGTKLGVYRGNGAGRFQAMGTWKLPATGDMLNIGDFDADGIPDLMATNLTSLRTFLLMGQATGGLTPGSFSFLFMPDRTMETDINFNGINEKISLFQYGARFSIAMSRTSSALRHISSVPMKLPVYIVLGDLLGEGRIDLGVAINK